MIYASKKFNPDLLSDEEIVNIFSESQDNCRRVIVIQEHNINRILTENMEREFNRALSNLKNQTSIYIPMRYFETSFCKSIEKQDGFFFIDGIHHAFESIDDVFDYLYYNQFCPVPYILKAELEEIIQNYGK